MNWFDAEDFAERALEMYERGRWSEAEAELRKALALNPDQAEWHFNLGLTLEAAHRDREAMACYQRSFDLMPGQVDPILAAGIVAVRLRKYERAIEWFDRAIKLDASCEPAYAHQIEAYTRLGRHDDAETSFYLAQQMLEERSAMCLSAVADSLIERGCRERAEWCLWEAIRLDPSITRLRARLGTVYAATGRARKALQLFIRDLRDDPGNIDTLLDYGETLLLLGRHLEATEKFRRVLELEPANVDAHYRLGEIALATGSDEQAYLELELVLKLDPHFPQIRVALAAALLRRGRTEQARRELEIELLRMRELGRPGPEDDPGRFGGLLLEAGLAEYAAEVFGHALDRQPASAELWRNLALARFRCGDRRGGVAASRAVLRLEPSCLVSMYNLALAAIDRGRLRVAGAWIARGLRVDRHDDGLRRLRMRWWARTIVSLVSNPRTRSRRVRSVVPATSTGSDGS